MKKIFIYSLFTLGLLSFTVSYTNSFNKTESTACKYGQCEATAKSTKKRCKNCVSKSTDSYCSKHK